MKYTFDDIILKTPKESYLTAIGPIFNKGRRRFVTCKCKCGNLHNIDITCLVSGHTLSCGCLRIERQSVATQFKAKFIGSNPILYGLWKNMISRCYDTKNIGYPLYGGKGVKVSDEWRENYQNFIDWAIPNGWEPGLHLDKDIKGNGLLYSKDTCIFVTPQINYMARDHVRKVIINGIERIAAHVASENCITRKVMYFRINKYSWPVLLAVTTPVTYYKNTNNRNVINWGMPKI